MSDLLDVGPENEDQNQSEIESPVDGPTPNWMQTAAASQGSSFNADEAPDWLKSIRAGKGKEPIAESEESADAQAAPSLAADDQDDSMSDLARLLAEEGIDFDDLDDERPAEAEGMSVKDWMIATSEDELIRNRVGAEEIEELPEPPEEPAPTLRAVTTTEDPDKLVVSDELPDWLQEISGDEEQLPESFDLEAVLEGEMAAEAGDMPDWLFDISDEAEPAAAPVSEPAEDTAGAEMPDWLREVTDSDEDMVEAEPVSAAMLDGDLPDWLQGVGAEEEEEPEEFVPAAEVQDWLTEISKEPAPVAEADQEKLVMGDDLPDWLREVEEESAPLADLPVETSAEFESSTEILGSDQDLPDWLRDVEAITTSSEEPFPFEFDTAPASLAFSASDESEIDEDNLPDWLRAAQEIETEAESLVELDDLAEIDSIEDIDSIDEDTLPDWLKEVQADIQTGDTESVIPEFDETESEADWLAELSESFGEEEEAEPETEPEELPDWLQEIQKEEEQVFEAPVPVSDELPAAELAEQALVQDEELPDWLHETPAEAVPVTVDETFAEPVAEAEPEAEVEMEAEELVEEEGLPDWLQAIEAEELEAKAEAEEFEAEAEAEPEAEELVEEEALSDWLQAIEAEEAEAEPVAEAEMEAEELVEEEGLPDWLQAIEAEEFEAEAEAEPVVEAEAEAEELVEEEGLPDWLQAIEAEEFEAEAEPVAEMEAEVEEVAPEIEEISVEELEEVEEVAAIWHEELEFEELAGLETEPEPEPLPLEAEEPAPEPAAARSGLTDLPDWLQKLRQGDVDEADIVPPAEPAVEPEPVLAAKAVKAEPVAVIEIPEEADERLRLAHQARDAGQIDQAVQYYDSLVSSSLYLDNVIDDLQQIIKFYPGNPMLFQVMGDAMMKDGRLQSALEAYRQALAVL